VRRLNSKAESGNSQNPRTSAATIITKAVVVVGVFDGEAEFDAEVFLDGIVQGREAEDLHPGQDGGA
jgi:hypothetical protein